MTIIGKKCVAVDLVIQIGTDVLECQCLDGHDIQLISCQCFNGEDQQANSTKHFDAELHGGFGAEVV
jgi:hypothetical protein